MVYATQADLTTRRITLLKLIQLTTDDKTANQPDAVVVSSALAEASARVDMYCGQRYALPLQPSLMVKAATVDLAIYELYGRRPGSLRPTDEPAVRYAESISMLKDIAAGKASLDQPDAPLDSQVTSEEVIVSTRRDRFDDCNLRGWA